MNVCDRSLQQGQFLDQPIAHQFEMLARKPFIGHFLISLSCRSVNLKLVQPLVWPDLVCPWIQTLGKNYRFENLWPLMSRGKSDQNLNINWFITGKCTTSENSRRSWSDNQNFFTHFLGFKIFSLLRIVLVRSWIQKYFLGQMEVFSNYQIWQVQIFWNFSLEKMKNFSSVFFFMKSCEIQYWFYNRPLHNKGGSQ